MDKSKEDWVEQSDVLTSTDPTIEPHIHWRTWVVFVSVAMLCSSVNYAVSSLGFWLPYTIGSLGGADIAIWFPDGGFTVQVGLTALFGLIADFGPFTRKYLNVGLCLVGSVGLFVAGSAKTMNVGIVGTALYGFSLISFVTEAAIVADIFPRRMRGIAQGNLYAIQALGAICANLGGGALIRDNAGGLNNGWRWNLYLSAILQLVGCGLILIFYHPIPGPNLDEPPFWKRLLGLDWIGVALWCVGLTCLMIGLIWGGGAYAWKSAPVITTLVIGAFFFLAFGAHQTFMKKDGVFHQRLFKNRNFPLALLAIWVEGFVYITLNVYLGQQIGTLYESRPVPLGAHFAVLLVASSLSSAFWGYYSKKTKSVKAPLVMGFAVFIASCIGFSQCRPGQVGRTLAWCMSALVGLGFGAPLALLLTVAQLAVDADLTALATAHILGIRSFGAIIGSAVAGAVFRPKLASLAPQYIAQYATAAGVPTTQVANLVGAIMTAAGAPVDLPDFTSAQLAAAELGRLQGYARAYSYIYYTIIPVAFIATVAVGLLRPVASAMTWAIDAPVETLEALGVIGAYAIDPKTPHNDAEIHAGGSTQSKEQ